MTVRQLAVTGPFMLPWTIMMVFYGTTLSSIHDAVTGNYKAGPFGLATMIIGSVVAILASVFLVLVVKRHLKHMVAQAEAKAKARKAKADLEENANPQAGAQHPQHAQCAAQ